MQRRRTLEQFAAPANRQPAVPAAEPAPLPHYIGPTMKLIATLISSWLKSADTRDASSFEVTLPGTRTKLTYNQKNETVVINDEVMELSWTPSTPIRSNLPNPTDPRIAGTLFALLEETHDGVMARIIPSLRADTHLMKYRSGDQGSRSIDSSEAKHVTVIKNSEKDSFFLQNLRLFSSLPMTQMHPENFHPCINLHSITVTGKSDIARLIECLERAFEKHKTRTIPVQEHDAVRMNFGK